MLNFIRWLFKGHLQTQRIECCSEQVIVADLNRLLRELCARLNRGSLNYSVDIALFGSPKTAGLSAKEIVTAALGNTATVGNTYSVTIAEIIEEVTKGINFCGDDGSHPNCNCLTSSSFQEMSTEILQKLRLFLSNADMVMGVWLNEGHPFYPVFWDFAFIVEHGLDAHLLVASSSD